MALVRIGRGGIAGRPLNPLPSRSLVEALRAGLRAEASANICNRWDHQAGGNKARSP